MEQNRNPILLNETSELMETIREQFEMLNSYEGRIPVLEFDILKNNIRNLYEKLIQLQKENDLHDVVFMDGPEIMNEQVKPAVKDTEIIETGAEPDDTEIDENPVADKTVEPGKEEPNPDLFSTETSAFNEKLMEAREQSLGPRTAGSKPADIKSLININDKFLFINDLFDGDYKEYSHAIEIFNNFAEKGEAFDFLDTLLKDNLWNSASPAFVKLKEIVEKRFI